MIEEPPDSNRKRDFYSLENMMDEEGILLRPRIKKGERAVMNPAVLQINANGPWPFLYRNEKLKKIDGKERVVSTIDLRWLINPTQLWERKKTIIEPTEEYEAYGCEDPRLSHINGEYYITYVAYDGLNARIALAKTKDFKEVKKLGIIGPEIELEEAIELVSDDNYKKVWQKQLEGLKEKMEKEKLRGPAILSDKDAYIDYDQKNKKWVLIHRLDPQMHIAMVDSLEELKNEEFWRSYLKNIKSYEFLRGLEPWEKEKIGLGSSIVNIWGKKIAVYHGVSEKEEVLDYNGGFLEIEDFKPKSRLRDPLFKPEREEHIFKYIDENGKERMKRVIFPTGIVQDPEDKDQLWVYYGMGDSTIGYRSTYIPWLVRELEHPHNKLVQAT